MRLYGGHPPGFGAHLPFLVSAICEGAEGLSTKDGIENEKPGLCRCVGGLYRGVLDRGCPYFSEDYRLREKLNCALFRCARNDAFSRGAFAQSEIVRGVISK